MGREVGGIISGPSRALGLLLLALSEKRDQKAYGQPTHRRTGV